MRSTNAKIPYINVPYVNFSPKNAKIKEELLAVFEKVLDSGRYIQGPEVLEFENEFSKYCGSKFAIGIANGTCSLKLTLQALDLPEGSEVITAPNSFIASASSIVLAGLVPTFVDVDEDMNLNVELIESAITSKTKVIMPVHLTGRPAKMDRVLEVAKQYNLYILEDAAQAVGAKYMGQRVGSFGIAGSFSLHPLKNLHAYGDAGIITTDNEELRNKLSVLKNHGLSNRTNCEIFSSNCRLDELQAGFLRVQLNNLDSWTEKRRDLAQIYNSNLNNVVEIPRENKNEYHVYQTYMIKTERRNELQKFLKSSGIETVIHYPTPIHLQPAAKNLNYKVGSFPMTEKFSNEVLSLPLYPGLTNQEQEYIIDKICQFYL
jgi:dTDP-4-amino-4,6-dideoxygalactose transaminase